MEVDSKVPSIHTAKSPSVVGHEMHAIARTSETAFASKDESRDVDYSGSRPEAGRPRNHISAAAPRDERFLIQPTLNTSSASGSDCSHGDRFGKHFKKCRMFEIRFEM